MKEKNHYVYLLESRVETKWYIGVRSCSCAIGEDYYLGSSTVMTKYDKSMCNKIILKKFTTRKEAVAYEIEMHNMFDVVSNNEFWNQAKQTSVGFDTLGRAMPEDEKVRRGLIQKQRYQASESTLKGRKSSQATKDKLRKLHTGSKRSNETKEKMSKASSGVNNSAFTPWWYELNGTKVEVYDKIVSEVAAELGVATHILKDRFRVRCLGKEKVNNPLKGIKVGRIIND